MPETNRSTLGAEDEKLVTLARSVRARIETPEGAAVRDNEGRTYVAGSVSLPSFQLSALQAVVAAALASGAHTLEAAVLVSAEPLLDDASINAVRDLSSTAPVYLADPDGFILQVLR